MLFVALAGAAIGRFEPREISNAMFATAAAHAVVAVIGLIAGLGPTLAVDAFFVAAWVASALCSGRQSSQAWSLGNRPQRTPAEPVLMVHTAFDHS